jgi:phage tail tape-measure protein
LPSGSWNHRIVCAPFEGQVFSSLRLRPFDGLTYVIRGQVVLMPAVATIVVCRWRAFSGGAAVRSAGDVGVDVTGRRGPSVVAP